MEFQAVLKNWVRMNVQFAACGNCKKEVSSRKSGEGLIYVTMAPSRKTLYEFIQSSHILRSTQCKHAQRFISLSPVFKESLKCDSISKD